ncbi:hypothetical protein BOW45_11010 [Solemya velum gill symbiont]|nr:hypothetical protein BOW45_11010 [Solemya velum gill symbiont]
MDVYSEYAKQKQRIKKSIMLKPRIILITAFAVAFQTALASSAIAGVTKGAYFGVDVGYSWLDDYTYFLDGSSSGDHPTDFDGGLIWTLKGGYGYDNGWRAELELSHRENDVDSFNDMDGSGSVTNTSLFLNALYDFDSGSMFTPFLGAGVGYMDIDVNNARHTEHDNPLHSNGGCCTGIVDGSDGVIGIQGIAGVSYAVSPTVSVVLDVRYVTALNDPEFGYGYGCNSDGTGCDGTGTLKMDYSNTSVNLGFRMQF